jgi:hypothetical protein
MAYINLRGSYNFFTYNNSTLTAISCFNANIILAAGYNENRSAPYAYKPALPPAFNQITHFRPGSGYYIQCVSPFSIETPDPLSIPDFIAVYNNYNFFIIFNTINY